MKTILFACTENKKRSKMSEAIFNHIAKEKKIDAIAISAGTIPAKETDPTVPMLLKEKGIAFDFAEPRKLTNELLEEADIIVSFGCLIADMFPKEKFREWLVDDPKDPEAYQKAYEDINGRVEELIQELS